MAKLFWLRVVLVLQNLHTDRVVFSVDTDIWLLAGCIITIFSICGLHTVRQRVLYDYRYKVLCTRVRY